MKRFFPFYTWARKNVPAQVRRHIQAPGRIGVFEKMRRNIEDSLGDEFADRFAHRNSADRKFLCQPAFDDAFPGREFAAPYSLQQDLGKFP